MELRDGSLRLRFLTASIRLRTNQNPSLMSFSAGGANLEEPYGVRGTAISQIATSPKA
jgi:hypothetical protein